MATTEAKITGGKYKELRIYYFKAIVFLIKFHGDFGPDSQFLNTWLCSKKSSGQ